MGVNISQAIWQSYINPIVIVYRAGGIVNYYFLFLAQLKAFSCAILITLL